MILYLADDKEGDSDENRSLKRFLFHKTTETSTQRSPSVLENLVFRTTTRKSIKSSKNFEQSSSIYHKP